MEYKEKVVLKNGQDCIIRNATYEDGPEMSDLYAVTHSESDYLLSYPEEHILNAKGESEFLQKRAESDNEVMLVAVVRICIKALDSWSLDVIRWDLFQSTLVRRNWCI